MMKVRHTHEFFPLPTLDIIHMPLIDSINFGSRTLIQSHQFLPILSSETKDMLAIGSFILLVHEIETAASILFSV
jgi:hypothetical protein